MEPKKFFMRCLLGAILMIIGSFLGNFIYFEYPLNLGSPLIGERRNTIFSILIFIFEYSTILGGLLIIFGVIIGALEYLRIGAFFISLGIILCLISIIIVFFLGIIIGPLYNKSLALVLTFISFNGGFGFTGVILTIHTRLKLREVI